MATAVVTRTKPELRTFAESMELAKKRLDEGLVLKVQSLVETEARGYKTAIVVTRALAQHVDKVEDYQSRLDHHKKHTEKCIEKLVNLFPGELARKPMKMSAWQELLQGLSADVLQAIAEDKGVKYLTEAGEVLPQEDLVQRLVEAQANASQREVAVAA
jgi:isopenicillin N synthase-like dioxygenase